MLVVVLEIEEGKVTRWLVPSNFTTVGDVVDCAWYQIRLAWDGEDGAHLSLLR